MKRLYFTVTNDLNYDQRMIRICSSLAAAGYSVTLVGRKKKDSLPLKERPFAQKRLSLLFDKGKLFYIEYNIRLFFWLLFRRMDVLCAIDLDTILPCLCLSRLRRITRVYDAHELFTEMKEVVSRPGIYRFWKWVERKAVPKFPVGYTVNEPIRDIFREQYGVQYEVIRNLPRVQTEYAAHPEPFILYQGAVNEGRSFETLIPAFQWIGVPFHIYGDGNYLEECRALIHRYGLQDKVFLKGKVLPEELRKITLRALIGLTLFENKGLSNY
ncbi:MAG TPA: glycosyltransferase [Chitinophagaceae bacterium]|jgi:glycosyltransferase involved in cell wall biosynthesis|nr:glycosyltransferase [Chitinophagaceae bacterium]